MRPIRYKKVREAPAAKELTLRMKRLSINDGPVTRPQSLTTLLAVPAEAD